MRPPAALFDPLATKCIGTVRAEPVEALFFLTNSDLRKKGRPFDKFRANG